jgi:hypothetical protein
MCEGAGEIFSKVVTYFKKVTVCLPARYIKLYNKDTFSAWNDGAPKLYSLFIVSVLLSQVYLINLLCKKYGMWKLRYR